MNNDLISRSALWTDVQMLPHNGDMISSEEVEQAIKEAPAVDAEKVYEHLGLVKEAFEMAKINLAPVVRCGECIHRHDPRRFSCQGRHKDWFCADGVRRRP